MQSEKTVVVTPFSKRRLLREIDLLAERLRRSLKEENARLLTEIALLKAENKTLRNRLVFIKKING